MEMHATLALLGLLAAGGGSDSAGYRPPFATVQQPLEGPFEGPYWGDGVTASAGDLDGDGREEVLLTGMSERLVLLRFDANGWTVRPTCLPVRGTPSEVEVVDLDGDGSPDFLVAASQGLQVHWNEGHGVFAHPQVLVPGNCTAAQAGDVNADGIADVVACVYLDAYVAGSSRNPGLVVLLGDGHRGFKLGAHSEPWSKGAELCLGDWNEDGHLDAAVDGFLDVGIYLGGGQGRMRAVDSYPGGASMRLTALDLDGDGHQDLARISFDEGLLPVLYGDGRGRFRLGAPFWPSSPNAPPPPCAYDLDAGDFDGDARADLLVVRDGRPTLYRSAPPRGFLRGEPLPLPWSTWAGALADVDGDGALDVVAHNPLHGEATPGVPRGWLTVLHGDGHGGLRGVRGARPDGFEFTFTGYNTIGDLDSDGLPDLVELLSMTAEIRVHRSDGAGGWSPPADHPTLVGLKNLRVGDVDGDGCPDVVAQRMWQDDLIVQLGDGRGGLRPPITNEFGPGASAAGFELGDLDGDGRWDVVQTASFARGGALSVRLSLGGARFGSLLHHPEPSFLHSPHPADVDLDGRTDILVLQSLEWDGPCRVLLLPGLGNGRFGSARLVQTLPGWIPAVHVGDLNGDGLPDIAVTVSGGGNGQEPTHAVDVHVAIAPGVFAAPIRTPVGIPARQLACGDLDGDGRPDLVAQDTGWGEALLRGQSDGRFEAWCRTGSASRLRAIADMDRDGRADLVYETNVVRNLVP